LPTIPSSRSLVIPLRNEAGRIGATLAALSASTLADGDLELLLIDDGSTDGTVDAAEAAVAAAGNLRAKVVVQDVHRGKGAAVREGLLLASGSARVFVDADLPVACADVERCFATLEAGRADVVYGSRTHAASRVLRPQPRLRVVSGRLFNRWLRVLGLTGEHDTQCGLKGVTAEAATVVVEPLTVDDFAFDVELLARARRAGLRTVAVPVDWTHVEASHVLPLRDGLAAARSAWRIRSRLQRERMR
jgi:dolichyl-phosphate beta-glucosyltransferase